MKTERYCPFCDNYLYYNKHTKLYRCAFCGQYECSEFNDGGKCIELYFDNVEVVIYTDTGEWFVINPKNRNHVCSGDNDADTVFNIVNGKLDVKLIEQTAETLLFYS